MDPVPPDVLAHINDSVPTLGARLAHLPYSRLRAAGTHRFGVLRAYLKSKSFYDLQTWTACRWRPLVSYRQHRWRVLLGLLSRF